MADTLGIKPFPNAECPARTCVKSPFLMFSTSSGAQFSGSPYNSISNAQSLPFQLIVPTLSYAPFSTYIIFSMPLTLAASSATDFTPLPATKAVIEPPSFCPAATAANDDILSFPSLCSSTANVDSNRAIAEYLGTAVGCEHRSCVRAWRRTDWRATGNMMRNDLHESLGHGERRSVEGGEGQ